MKFVVVLLLVAVGLSQAQESATMMDASAAGFNHSQCIVKPEERIFSCKSAGQAIECPASVELSQLGDRWSIFGLSMIQGSDESRFESMRYWLYPRKMNASSYMNRSVELEGGRSVDLQLWAGESRDSVGIRITDVKCYERLVRLFADAGRAPHMVRLEAGSNIVQEIPLFGEVLVMDKNVQKRWLWGYGWGLGYGWGWGGWGWPYYGYGWW